MNDLGRIIAIIGGGLLVVGRFLMIFGRTIPLGRLPGDILIRRPGMVLYFPITTAIILSLILSLVLRLLRR